MHFCAQVKLDELEMEFRAQIETVLAAGLKPTHLDWHALRFGGRTDIFDLMIRLAKEYGLALRVIGRPAIEKVQSQGLPDHRLRLFGQLLALIRARNPLVMLSCCASCPPV